MSANTPGGYLGQGPLPRTWKPEPKVQPLPKTWKEGDPLPQGTFSQPGYTPDQQAQIEWAQTRPGVDEIVYPVQDRLRDSQRRSDVAWGASNAILDTGARLAAEDPSIAGAIRGKAAEYAMSHGMDAQRANNEWEKDRTRLDAISTDPRGAELYERYKQGQIPGYQITSNPSVSPYWKKLVAEEPIGRNPARYGNIQREGSSSRVGMAPTTLQSEAMGQMTRYANRLAEGRGGGAIRDAMAMYQAALMSGDEAATAAAESQLGTLLDPMFAKFQGRFAKEAGDIGVDLKQQFMQSLRAKVGAGMAGVSPDGMMRSPGAIQQLQKAGTPGAPATRSQSQPSVPRKPRVTPDGLRIHEFDSVQQVTKAMQEGTANIRGGEMVVVGGIPMTGVPSVNQYGEPEMALVEATMFGGMAVPDPNEFADQADWGAALSDGQRQAVLDQLATDPAMRSSLGRDTLEELDRVRRSRQGVLSQRMRPADRERSLAELKAREDAALYAAVVGGVGQRARSRAITSISAADAADIARADEKSAITNERARTKAGLDAVREAPPMHAEAFSDDLIGDEGPKADPFVTNAWNSMGSGERGVVNDMLMVAAGLGGVDEEGNPIEGGEHLPIRELRRLVRMAGQGADEMQLAAVIEASKPGFVKEYFGGNVQLTSMLADNYSKFSKEYDAWAKKQEGQEPDPAQVRKWIMQQHSWMLIRHRLGMMPPEEAKFFAELPPEAQSDPELYANEVIARMQQGPDASQAGASPSQPTTTALANMSSIGPSSTIPDRINELRSIGMQDAASALQSQWNRMTAAERDSHLRAARMRQEAEAEAAKPKPAPRVPRPDLRQDYRTPIGHSFSPGGGQSLVGNNPRP